MMRHMIRRVLKRNSRASAGVPVSVGVEASVKASDSHDVEKQRDQEIPFNPFSKETINGSSDHARKGIEPNQLINTCNALHEN